MLQFSMPKFKFMIKSWTIIFKVSQRTKGFSNYKIHSLGGLNTRQRTSKQPVLTPRSPLSENTSFNGVRVMKSKVHFACPLLVSLFVVDIVVVGLKQAPNVI